MPTTRGGSDKAESNKAKNGSEASSKEHTLKRGREASLDPAAPEAQASAASASTKKNRLDSTTETSEPLDSAPTSADAGGEMDQDAPVSASASMSRSSSGESSARSERSAKSSSSKSSKSGKSNSKDKDKSKSKKGKSKSRSGEPREGDEIKAQDGKPGREGKKVKDVRHKVERLSHNGEAVSASTAEVEGQELEKEKNGAAPSPVASAMDVESAQPTEQPLHARVDTADKVMESTPMDKSTSSGGSRSKRKAMDRSASSFAGGEDEGEEAKRVKDDDSAVAAAEKPTDPVTVPAPAPTPAKPKKTQTTFASFSSAASPFARASPTSSAFGSSTPAPAASVAAPPAKPISEFRAPEPSAPPSAASASEKASAVDIGNKQEAPSEQVEKAEKPKATFGVASTIAKPKTTQSSGFGSFASISPFAGSGAGSASGGWGSGSGASAGAGAGSASGTGETSTGTSTNAFASSSFTKWAAKPAAATIPKSQEEAGAGEGKGAGAGAGAFGDILKGEGTVVEEEGKMQMEEQSVTTGEEDEETKYSLRTKLYSMEPDGGWKERGVGVLRLNVRKEDGKGARLVMRADGVLRLILNVSLYAGMNCLEDGKHVRLTVFEEGERRLVTLRTGNPKAAAELAGAIQAQIPLGGGGKLDV